MSLRLLVLVALAAAALPAAAQYPSRPIKILPNAAAGTGPDIMARLLGARLQETMGQAVVVENRPGANGNIAGELVAQSAPDGYTLLLATDAQVTVNPHVYAKLGFDWIRDFVPVSSLATEAFKLVVANDVPARSVAEFIAYAKGRSQPMFYGSSGTGSQHHLTMEMLKERTGIQLTHIPYKGGGSATAQALLAGEVQATIGGAAVDAHVKAGKLRALGITSPRRSPRYPDLPTIGETLAGFEMVAWYGLFAPAATPAEPLARLRTEVGRFLALPEVQAKINASGPEAWASAPEEFGAMIRRDYERNGKLVKALGIKLE
jgi:tripartite-type tricarboxylate transporter receptor subunit TctC